MNLIPKANISVLVSVVNPHEAMMAIESGADIIDLKDPNSGALGALSISCIRNIMHHVGDAKPISATIGDVPLQPEVIEDKIRTLMQCNVTYIKVGFFLQENTNASLYQCINALSHLPKEGAKLIAVLFADQAYPDGLIRHIQEAGFVGIMLDTEIKDGRTIFDHYSEERLSNFADQMMASGLIFGLAGSLNINHIEKLKIINPDYVGFRGGVCELGQRVSGLDASKVRDVCKVL